LHVNTVQGSIMRKKETDTMQFHKFIEINNPYIVVTCHHWLIQWIIINWILYFFSCSQKPIDMKFNYRFFIHRYIPEMKRERNKLMIVILSSLTIHCISVCIYKSLVIQSHKNAYRREGIDTNLIKYLRSVVN